MIAPLAVADGFPWTWPVFVAAAYFIGAIPFGFILAKRRGVDIRAHGSGNIGATNVGRVLGKKLGRVCLVLDMAKGATPTLAAGLAHGLVRFGELPTTTDMAWWIAVAAAAVAGHMFPIYLKGRGGKGVATGLGSMLGIAPVLTLAGIAAALVWIVSVKLTRFVGVSSCAAAASLPLWVALSARLLTGPGGAAAAWPWIVATALLAGVVILKHRGNIARTLRGTEPRIDDRHEHESSPPAQSA